MFAWWVPLGVLSRSTWVAVGAVIAFVLIHESPIDKPWDYIGESVAAALLVQSVHHSRCLDRGYYLRLLGDWSYGTYLLHVPVITIVFAWFGLAGWYWFFTVAVTSYVIGASFGAIEHHMHNSIKYIADRSVVWFSMRAVTRHADHSA